MAPSALCHLTGRSGGRAGRHTVVDDHHGAAVERNASTPAPVQLAAPLQLHALTGLDVGDFPVVDADHPDDVGVDHAHIVLTDRSHAQFGLERNAQLSHEDHVEWSPEFACHFGRHRYTASGQTDDDGVGAAEVTQAGGESLAGVDPVAEHVPSSRRVL